MKINTVILIFVALLSVALATTRRSKSTLKSRMSKAKKSSTKMDSFKHYKISYVYNTQGRATDSPNYKWVILLSRGLVLTNQAHFTVLSNDKYGSNNLFITYYEIRNMNYMKKNLLDNIGDFIFGDYIKLSFNYGLNGENFINFNIEGMNERAYFVALRQIEQKTRLARQQVAQKVEDVQQYAKQYVQKSSVFLQETFDGKQQQLKIVQAEKDLQAELDTLSQQSDEKLGAIREQQTAVNEAQTAFDASYAEYQTAVNEEFQQEEAKDLKTKFDQTLANRLQFSQLTKQREQSEYESQKNSLLQQLNALEESHTNNIKKYQQQHDADVAVYRKKFQKENNAIIQRLREHVKAKQDTVNTNHEALQAHLDTLDEQQLQLNEMQTKLKAKTRAKLELNVDLHRIESQHNDKAFNMEKSLQNVIESQDSLQAQVPSPAYTQAVYVLNQNVMTHLMDPTPNFNENAYDSLAQARRMRNARKIRKGRKTSSSKKRRNLRRH